MFYRRTLATVALALSASLTACTINPTERPSANYPTGSPEPVPTLAAPTGAPALTVVDASPGGPADSDPLWQGLKTAAAQSSPIYVDAVIHTGAEVSAGSRTSLTPDTPDSVSVTADSDVVSSVSPGFYRLRGTFTVEEIGASAYELTTESANEIPGFIPGNKTLDKECTQPEAATQIGSAAQELAGDPGTREDLRKTWISVPELWWAIQRSAQLMRSTNGETEGDFFFQACESVRGDS